MTQKFKLTMLILFSLVASALTPLGLIADNKNTSANQIVDRVQKFYAEINDYKAEFTQTTAHKMYAGRYQRAYGNVMFKKGGLMRWEYTKPETKLFIYDGSTLWIYEPEVPQIFKGTANADRLKKALAFLTGEGRIKDEYTPKKLNSKKYDFDNGYVLKLIPKDQNSPFQHVELYVNPDTYRVVRSVVVDHEGNRNRLDFKNPIFNTNLNSKMFNFTPPAGVPVIDAQNQ